MQIRILLFGAEARAVNADHITVEFDPASPATCQALRDTLEQTCPALRPHMASARIAVNSEFAVPDQTIKSGDEVALIGLVGGG